MLTIVSMIPQLDENEVVYLGIRLADIPEEYIQVQGRQHGGRPFLKATITVKVKVSTEVAFVFRCGRKMLNARTITL
jgi:hypothetical protein